MLRYQYQKSMMLQQYYDRQEREQLIKDVAEEVLSRLSATIDVEDIVKGIKELNDEIERLGK